MHVNGIQFLEISENVLNILFNLNSIYGSKKREYLIYFNFLYVHIRVDQDTIVQCKILLF